MSLIQKRRTHPEETPTTADAASVNSYHVYFQVVYWKTLMN